MEEQAEIEKINKKTEQWRKTQVKINYVDKVETGGALSPEVKYKKTSDDVISLI